MKLSTILLAASVLVAAPAWADKIGLGVGAGAAAVKDDLLEMIGEHGTAVETPKAPAKGGKRKAWAKDAQKSLGLVSVVTAEVAGKRLKLGLWIDGKPVSATGANLKGKSLDGAGKAAIKSWLKAQLSGGGGAVAARGGGGDEEEEEESGKDEEEEAPPVVAPPAKPGKGAAVAQKEPRSAPVVAPPPPPRKAAETDEDEEAPGRAREDDRSTRASSSGRSSGKSPPAAPKGDDEGGERDIAGGSPGRSGDFGGGMLGSALGIAPGLPPLFVLRAEFHTVGRGFSYSDPITANLRPYSVGFMPTPGVTLEAYPLTVSGVKALSALGVTFGFRTSLGVKSARANSSIEFPTTYAALEVGALYRIMLGDGYSGGAIIPSIGWSSTTFDLDPVGNEREDQLPNVSYPGLRLGLGFDVPLFSTVRLLGDGAFLVVGTPGEIISSDFFRAGSVNGVVAKVGFSVGLLDHVAAEVGVTYQHFFYAFDPEVGDAFVAGGALDQFVVGRAGVRVDL